MSEMLAVDTPQLERQAVAVLAHNDRGSYTVPSSPNYENSIFLWDSAEHVLGLVHHSPERAAVEAASPLIGQWRNGMIPNQIYTRDRPVQGWARNNSHLVWASKHLSRDAPRSHHTSGITQPPTTADAIEYAGRFLPRDDRHALYASTIGKLIHYHNWIYRERDYQGNGLFAAVHPWETGMDNTPPWMTHMATLDWGNGAGRHLPGSVALARRLRQDTKLTSAEERSSDHEIAHSINATRALRRARYDYHRLQAEAPLHVEDVMVNASLEASNTALRTMADSINFHLPEVLQANMAKTEASIDELWDEHAGLYYARDAVSNQPIKVASIASLVPLYSHSHAPERARRLLAHLDNPASFQLEHGVPSMPLESAHYREVGYWAGLMWTNVVRRLIDGARTHQADELANRHSHRILRTIANAGMRENFSARTGQGTGVYDFSWTAADTIHLIHTTPRHAA